MAYLNVSQTGRIEIPVESSTPGNVVQSPKGVRNMGIDAYRGFVMFLMLAEVLSLPHLAAHYPDSIFWRIVGFNTEHVDWYGCSLHDLIQPSFSFLVGAALAYSVTKRLTSGQSQSNLWLHTLWRSLVLVGLGIFLRSLHAKQTYFTFEDTLTQIGLGYPFLFLLSFYSERTKWIALAVILFGFWLAYVLYPLPGPSFDYTAVGVPADWPYHASGLAAHFNKNSNLGQAFDLWFLNSFPREKFFAFNGGGYLTLSFIPTLGTMILGLIGGRWLQSGLPQKALLRKLITAGLALILAGAVLHFLGICPIVKRIWTPSWTLFSGGLCFLLLTIFYGLIDVAGYRRWAFLFVVIGMNSIAAYLMSWTLHAFLVEALQRHFGRGVFQIFGEPFADTIIGLVVLTIYCLVLLWMYRRKIFLRI